MATVIRNSSGDAINEAAANLLRTALAVRQMEQQESQFTRSHKQDQAQFSQTLAQRKDEEAARAADSERDAAFRSQMGAITRLTEIMPYLPTGRAVADIPELHALMKQAYPEFDPTDRSALGGIVLNEETVQGIMRDLGVQHLRQLELSDPAAFNDFVGRYAAKEALGVATSPSEMMLSTERAQGGLQGLRHIMADDNLREDWFRTQFGLSERTFVTLPDGTVRQFRTPEDARLSISLLQRNMEHDFQLSTLDNAERKELAGELMQQYADLTNNQRQLGRVQATQIVNAYLGHLELSPEERGTEADPWQSLIAAAANDPDLTGAINLFTASADQADLLMASLPERHRNTLGLFQWMRDQGGMDQEQALSFAESLTEAMPEIYAGVHNRWVRPHTLEAPGIAPAGVPNRNEGGAVPTGAAISGDLDVRTEAITRLMSDPNIDPSELDETRLRQAFGDDAYEAAAGNLIQTVVGARGGVRPDLSGLEALDATSGTAASRLRILAGSRNVDMDTIYNVAQEVIDIGNAARTGIAELEGKRNLTAVERRRLKIARDQVEQADLVQRVLGLNRGAGGTF